MQCAFELGFSGFVKHNSWSSVKHTHDVNDSPCYIVCIVVSMDTYLCDIIL